jgi:hypothetical protein
MPKVYDLQSIESLASELEEAERIREAIATATEPRAGALAERHRLMVERPQSQNDWIRNVWAILTAMLRRLVACIESVRPELDAAKNERHIIWRLLKQFDDVAEAIDTLPADRSSPIGHLAKRAALVAMTFDDLAISLAGNHIVNGERRAIQAPWGGSWTVFMDRCEGQGDVNNRIGVLAGAIDFISDWLVATNRLKEDAPLRLNESERPPAPDDDLDLDEEERAALETPEAEAAIEAATVAAPEAPVELPPPRVFHRRNRKIASEE